MTRTATRKADGAKVRFEVEPSGNYFVFAKRKKIYGKRYTPQEFLNEYIPEEKDKDAARYRRMSRCIKKLEKSGLWPDIKTVFENIVNSNMSLQDRDEIRELWFNRNDKDYELKIAPYEKKYPFAFTKIINNNGVQETFVETDYIYELSECKTKSMYFGKYHNKHEKEMLKIAIEKGTPYRTPRYRVGYDVSASVEPQKQKAWYSEEYRGCGNGHYFIAIDENTAIFVETD